MTACRGSHRPRKSWRQTTNANDNGITDLNAFRARKAAKKVAQPVQLAA